VAEEGRGDQGREGGEGADMAGAADQPVAERGAQRVAREVGRGDNPRYDRIDMRVREADADQGADVSVGELNQANAQDKRADSCDDTGHVISSITVRSLNQQQSFFGDRHCCTKRRPNPAAPVSDAETIASHIKLGLCKFGDFA
jgi:hypothetical protein